MPTEVDVQKEIFEELLLNLHIPFDSFQQAEIKKSIHRAFNAGFVIGARLTREEVFTEEARSFLRKV